MESAVVIARKNTDVAHSRANHTTTNPPCPRRQVNRSYDSVIQYKTQEKAVKSRLSTTTIPLDLMPSGPKKRKAAKKKKETQLIVSASPNCLGDDDLGSPGSKEGGEMSSPASQDHDDELEHFAENGAEENGVLEKVSHPLPEGHAENSGKEEVGTVGFGSQVEIEDVTDKEHGRSEYKESGCNTDEDHHSGLRALEQTEEDVVNHKEELNPNERTVQSEILHSSIDKDDQTHDINDAELEKDLNPVDTGNVGADEARSEKENESNEENKTFDNEEVQRRSASEDSPFAAIVDKVQETVYNVDSSPVQVGEVNHSVDQESGGSKIENSPLAVSKTLPLIEHVTRERGVVDEKVDDLKNSKDGAGVAMEELVTKNVGTTNASSAKELTADTLFIHKNKITSLTSADDGAEHNGDLGLGANEPLLFAAPGALQKTSWKSCCGLFEAFKGSH